jgi:Na+/H+ antiporter NhaD/arsenite permease-like protein
MLFKIIDFSKVSFKLIFEIAFIYAISKIAGLIIGGFIEIISYLGSLSISFYFGQEFRQTLFNFVLIDIIGIIFFIYLFSSYLYGEKKIVEIIKNSLIKFDMGIINKKRKPYKRRKNDKL